VSFLQRGSTHQQSDSIHAAQTSNAFQGHAREVTYDSIVHACDHPHGTDAPPMSVGTLSHSDNVVRHHTCPETATSHGVTQVDLGMEQHPILYTHLTNVGYPLREEQTV